MMRTAMSALSLRSAAEAEAEAEEEEEEALLLGLLLLWGGSEPGAAAES
jgi:hypothetical protein